LRKGETGVFAEFQEPGEWNASQGNWKARKKAAPGEIGLVSEIEVPEATLVRIETQLSGSVFLVCSTTDFPAVVPLTSNTSWPPVFRTLESSKAGGSTVMEIEFVTAASP